MLNASAQPLADSTYGAGVRGIWLRMTGFAQPERGGMMDINDRSVRVRYFDPLTGEPRDKPVGKIKRKNETCATKRANSEKRTKAEREAQAIARREARHRAKAAAAKEKQSVKPIRKRNGQHVLVDGVEYCSMRLAAEACGGYLPGIQAAFRNGCGVYLGHTIAKV